MSCKFEMLSSVARKNDAAAESVEHPVDDGSRCAVSPGVLPASSCTFSAVSTAVISPDGVSVLSAAWMRVTAREGLLVTHAPMKVILFVRHGLGSYLLFRRKIGIF